MSSLFITPFSRPLGSDGRILPLGQLLFYYTGTLNEAPVYDEDGDVLDQPVRADITGVFPNVYLDESATYRARLLNALGVEQGDADPATGFSALSLTFQPSGTGGVATSIQNKLLESAASIEDYRLPTDSVEDAILKAVAARKVVKFAEGGAYEFSRVVDISAFTGRALLTNGATITAASGFDDPHMMIIAGDTRIMTPGTWQGAGMNDPTAIVANITGVSRGTTTTITTDAAHGLKEGQPVVFASVVGTTQLNGNLYYVTNPGTTTFEIQNATGDLDTTAFSAYVSGGTATFSTTYAAAAYAGVAIFISAGGNFGLIEDQVFEDFPSGPILQDSRVPMIGFCVRRCGFYNVQTFTAAATNGCVAYHGMNYGRQENCYIEGYNWKGFYVSQCQFAKIVRCDTVGGVDGHASHYLANGTDNSILDCTQVGVNGVGFGFKCSDTTRPTVRNFASYEARSSGMFQGCEDFIADSIVAWNTTTSSLFVEGSSTYGANTRGIVSKFRARRSMPGTAVNHRGIYMESTSGISRTITGVTKANPAVVTSGGHGFKEAEAVTISGVVGMTQLNGNTYYTQNVTEDTFELRTATGNVDSTGYTTYTSGGTAAGGGKLDKITVRDSYFENYLYGIHVANTGFANTNIEILNNEFYNCSQYGVLGYIGSGRIIGNKIHLDGSATNANVLINGDGVTTTGVLEINDNEFLLASGDIIQIGAGGARFSYNQVRIANNRAKGGARFLNYFGNNNAADVVNHLVVTGNTGTGITTAGLVITFNATTSIVATIRDNVLLNASFAGISDTLTNLTHVTWRSMILSGTTTTDVASIAAGAIGTVTVTVTGAALGDPASFGFSTALTAGLNPSAFVSAADTVTINLHNTTAGAIDPASRTYSAMVRKA